MSDKNKAYQEALHFIENDSITLDSFYEGQNKVLLKSLKNAIKNLKHELFFIHGPEGCGKSHLLTGLFNTIENRGKMSYFMDLNIAFKLSPEVLLVNPYPITILDNIEAIAGNPAFELNFFDLYNTWLEGNYGPLIIASQLSYDKIPFLRKDINTRLSHGLSFLMQRLNDEDCAKALELKAKKRGFTLSNKVSTYLVRHCNAYMPTLGEILDKLDIASLQQKRDITIPFIKEVLNIDD